MACSGMDVTLVIPAKNEKATLVDMLPRALPLVDEVIVVDAHSSDGTADAARALGAKVIFDNGRGKGEAVRMGIQAAAHPCIVLMDADGSHDPADIPRLVSALDQGLDLVIGSRIRGGSDEWSGSFGRFIRMMGSHLVLIAINYRWGIRITDCQNGFRAIRADIARSLDLAENGFAIEQEMVMRALIKRCTVGEIGCHEYERKAGSSKLNLFRVWPDILRTLVVLSFKSRARPSS
ncbi:MAG: glycosyltransferase family 2 protein [Candidatus Eisenbacteria bacterium]|jgi:glycosyltransferase involved in cell wall biosynthesis|nr:glycosyltransferase family 2 protein [Candidatus Eisenbacteria bacterium]